MVMRQVAFRFCFLYLGLFTLATQISGSLLIAPGVFYRGMGQLWPMRTITFWSAEHIFGIHEPAVYTRFSGETVFLWIQTFWILVVAIAGTAIWTALDKRANDHAWLHKWFRLFIRWSLAASMFEYGMTKIIPVQFPQPSLNTLVTPAGNLSLSNLLWTSVGAAPAYEVFTGAAEMLGGILLLVPRTTMLGAMISLAALTNVFVLNMTYDIGLKQVSFHLILLALFLLAPDFSRLANFFYFDRATIPSTQAALFRTRGANRIAFAAQIVLGIYLIGMQTYANWSYWYATGGGSPRSPLYGIWNVEQFLVDGQPRAPFQNDYDRQWRRAIFDAPGTMTFQRSDDSFAHYGISMDEYQHTIRLTKGSSRTWLATFAYQRPQEDRLILEGEMDGHRIRTELQLLDFDAFRLLNSRFRWIRPDEQ